MAWFISLLTLLYLIDVYLTVGGMVIAQEVDPIKVLGLVVKITIILFLYYFYSPTKKQKRKLQRVRKRLEMLSPERWLIESIQFYRSLGFFQFTDKGAMNDQEIAQEIIRIRNEGKDALRSVYIPGNTFTAFKPTQTNEDIYFLQCDVERVWAFTTEHIDEFTNEHSYREFLEQWGRISRGVFAPTNITYSSDWWKHASDSDYAKRSEEWANTMHWDPVKDHDNDAAWIPVRFDYNNRTYTIRFPHPGLRWYTGRPFRELNEIIIESGYQFVWHVFDESFIVLFLTPAEQKSIEEERGWKLNPEEFRY